MSARAQRILDAAIQLVGAEGIRALTHRAVDAAAGLPIGSTSNLYRTREALLRAMVVRMVDAEFAGWDQLAAKMRTETVEDFVDALVELIELLSGPMRALSVARYSLFMEAARDPELAAEMGRAAGRVASVTTQWLRQLGSRDPEVQTPIVMAYLDGLIVHRLALPPEALSPVIADEVGAFVSLLV